MEKFKDIDKFRLEWNKLSNNSLKDCKTIEEIENITRQKSKNEINKIKRKFVIESVFSLLLLVGMFILVNKCSVPNEALIFNVFFGLVIAVYLFFLIPVLKKLPKKDDCSLYVYLDNTLSLLKKIYRVSVVGSIVLIPISMLCGFAMGVLHDSDGGFYSEVYEFFSSEFESVIRVCLFLLAYLILYYIVVYYYKYMYGKHLINLENIFNELKMEEGEDN